MRERSEHTCLIQRFLLEDLLLATVFRLQYIQPPVGDQQYESNDSPGTYESVFPMASQYRSEAFAASKLHYPPDVYTVLEPISGRANEMFLLEHNNSFPLAMPFPAA